VLKLLRSMKSVRGTSLDLLGQTRVRRIERELPGYYMALIDVACAQSNAASALLVELAETPDLIRGYEHVKVESLATRFLPRVMALQRRMGIVVPVGPELSTVKVDEPALSEQLRAA